MAIADSLGVHCVLSGFLFTTMDAKVNNSLPEQ